MRFSFWTVLLGLGLMCCLARMTPPPPLGEARAQAPAAVQPGERPVPASTEVVVVGYGRNAESAREVALEKARDKVVALLRKELRDPDWQPQPESVVLPEHLLEVRVVTPKGAAEQRDFGGERGVVARYRIQLTAEYVAEVERAARTLRQRERQGLLLRGLGGAVVLLLVAAGYLRLEEATRGYYTKLLRLAAVLVVALAGLGVWLTLP
jgi:hypothetical protein